MLQSKQWQEWATTVTEEALLQLFSYKTFKGDPFTQPLYEVVFHVFNHSTYHRGQLVTILRQLGVEKIPSTDLIVFYRYNK
ncbi:MAG: DinB family protein [Ferruginibacter sp.]